MALLARISRAECFAEDVRRLKALYVELLDLQLRQASFEERFHILDLNFPIEWVQQESLAMAQQNDYCYCFFVNQKGIRYLQLGPMEAELASKIKVQGVLSAEEKKAALDLLRKLAL